MSPKTRSSWLLAKPALVKCVCRAFNKKENPDRCIMTWRIRIFPLYLFCQLAFTILSGMRLFHFVPPASFCGQACLPPAT